MPRATEGTAMTALWKYALSLALGLTPALAFAQGLQWRPSGNPAAASSQAGGTSVGLSKPVPLDGPTAPIANPGAVALQPLVRGQIPEDSKPLPPGPFLSPGGSIEV